MKKEFLSRCGTDTKALAETFGARLSGKTRIALTGELGAGKTTFVQGLAKGLDVPESYYITSPTYNIISEYPGRIPLYHADLYRITDGEELELTGFFEYAEEKAVLAVEWPELVDAGAILFDCRVHLALADNGQRLISIFASGRGRYNLLENLLL